MIGVREDYSSRDAEEEWRRQGESGGMAVFQQMTSTKGHKAGRRDAGCRGTGGVE